MIPSSMKLENSSPYKKDGEERLSLSLSHVCPTMWGWRKERMSLDPSPPPPPPLLPDQE